MKKYLNQRDMKDRNVTNVFRLIRKKGPITRRQIESETGLSWGAVSGVTAKLIDLGYVHECKEPDGAQNAAGRTPIYLEADCETYFVIGVDVNASGFRGVLMNLCGCVAETVCAPATCDTAEALISGVSSLLEALLALADGKRVLCIGVAMQGEVDSENGISVRFPRCEGGRDLPLAAILEERFGLPVFLEHDPNCILYAYSVPSHLEEAILVRIDCGIGMAVLMNGKIFDRLGAFELGHTVVHRDGAVCSCGKRGCLEAYASMTGMAERSGIAFEALAERARRGEDTAVSYFRETAECLAVAITNAVQLLNLRGVVLCGDLLKERDLFYGQLVAEANRITGERQLAFSVTDVAEAARGGAMIALERYALRLE